MKKITLLIALVFSIPSVKAQDSCNAPLSLTGPGTYAVGVINGTAPTLFCATNGAIPAAYVPAGEWYLYTPTQNYTVTITTDIAANTPRKDTRIHVYTGACPSLVCFAGDDDGGSGYSSVVTFNVTAGTPYIIVFDNRWLNTTNNTGFSFQLIEGSVVVPTPQRITYTTQSISTINSTYNLCVVDMDGDRKDDIVGVSPNNLKVHYQRTGDTFSLADYPITGTSSMPSWSIAAGDYNKDGYNDLMLGGGSAVTFWKSNNTGTTYANESFSQYVFCQRTNFVDLNNDGNLDAFSCHDVDPNVYFTNDGSGTLTFYQSGITSGATTMGVHPEGGNYGSIFIDYDNDGDQDLFIAKCRGGSGTAKFNELHRNNGDGTFTDVSVAANLYDPLQTWSSAWADFDNDGDLDVVVGASSTSDGSHKYMKNNGNSTFTNATVGSGWDTNTSTNIEHVAHDFDNDGFVDVLGGGNKIMFNMNGTFAPSSYPSISVGGIGDLNNDGFLDFLNGNTIRYAVPNNNNWLKVNLKGIASNSYGIGARVEIYGSWGKQIRDVHSGDGFKYMSSLNAHFGIGLATTISQVIVRWPSGIVDTFANVNPNQALYVVEGVTLAANSFNNNVFAIYPIPAKNILNIQLKDNLSVTLKSAAVYDLTGKIVLETSVLNQPINVEKLATGTYILSISDTNDRNYTQKFIKE